MVCAAGLVSLLCSAREASAQGLPYSPYSPWLELFRRDAGPLGAYLSNVRPLMQLRRQLTGQSIGLRRQGAQIGTLRQQIVTQTPRDVVEAPTGRGGTFMNYSHFYEMPQTGAATRRQTPSFLSGGGYGGFSSFGYGGSISRYGGIGGYGF